MAETELIDHTGRTVFRGTQKPPGGGSQPLSESISGAGPNPVADGATVNTAVQHNGGDALLDYSDPTAPTVIAAGLYALTAMVVCFDGPQLAGNWNLSASMLGSVLSQSASQDGPLSGGAAGVSNPTITGTVVCPMSAGDVVTFAVSNFAGSPGNLNLALAAAVLVKLA